jgi:hypothetical protein
MSSCLPDDGDRIQSPKHCGLKYKQEDILDKDETMGNVRERNGCVNDSDHCLAVFLEAYQLRSLCRCVIIRQMYLMFMYLIVD